MQNKDILRCKKGEITFGQQTQTVRNVEVLEKEILD